MNWDWKVVFNKIWESKINRLLALGGISAFVFVVAFFVWWNQGISFSINNENGEDEITNVSPSSISGLSCSFSDRRPIAVMMSSDEETRPLSGISDADMVFEMPVTPNGITRIMAVFQCESPKEVGSIRSARGDFIPLAAGLGAVYAHWGGEREALEKLNSHIVDNIDAMKYDGVYYYRKSGIKQPHNGFADLETLFKGSKDLGYADKNFFSGYIHSEKKNSKSITNIAEIISINYPFPLNVLWTYDKSEGSYRRSRGGEFEIDKNNQEQVEASVVMVMETDSTYVSKDYLNVRTTGEGNLRLYQNGVVVSGRWKKGDSLDDKLYFYDNNGKEIEFKPGKIWVEIIINN